MLSMSPLLNGAPLAAPWLAGSADALWCVKRHNLGAVLACNAGALRTARELAPAGARALQTGVQRGF